MPDYTQSCQDLYIAVGAALLRQGHLSALSLAQFSKFQPGLPSWVPDWSQPLGDTLQGTSIDHMTPDPPYNVSRSLLPTAPVFSGIGAEMGVSVSGFIYDEIHDFCATWADFCSPHIQDITHLPLIPAKKYLEEILRLSFLRKTLYKDFKELISGVARTATAEIGYNDKGRWARTGNQRYQTAVTLLMIRANSPSETRSFDSELLELGKRDGIQPTIDGRSAALYCGEIVAKAFKRRPFVTTKGYLGLGPDDIKAGDVIALVMRSQVPFVLREIADGKYKLIGEAYVDGIMDGEAVAGRENVGVIKLI